MESNTKVTASHLKRNAFLYVRQSSMRQVVEHTESATRQYALKKRAVSLGWSEEQVVVVDNDQGMSGESAAERGGFQSLVTEVSMGRAGIVLGLEVSRLARNNADWHRLLEICALTDTLILDEDGLYDPGQFNDRLLLGLKGAMSEAELHVIKARLRGGVLNKARRGELATPLPVGFTYNDEKRVILDPDQQVQQAVRAVFETFRRVGSAFGVVRAFRQQGLRFPVFVDADDKQTSLRWGDVNHHQIVRVLKNPRYAGAYFFGRTRHQKRPNSKRGRSLRLPREEWHTLIPDAHRAYITWQEYEENLQRLHANAVMIGVAQRGPVREGPALLQGLLMCGVCGTRMSVAYHKHKRGLEPDYICSGRSEADRTERGYCHRIPGASIDRAIGDLLVAAVTPLALEVTLTVQQELQTRWQETDRLRRMQVDRARYEADLARRRFLRVDPDNRLVASSLETEWNEKLRLLADAEQNFERQRQVDQSQLSSDQRAKMLALSADFTKLWRDPGTPDRERKRMVRLLIEDVTISREERILLQIRFRGGKTTTLTIPRPLGYCQARKQSPELIRAMDCLLDDYNYDDVARILREKGFQTGGGVPLSATAVGYIRIAYGLKSRFERLRERGLLTLSEISEKLGISMETIYRHRKLGILRAHRYDGQNRCLYEDPGPGYRDKGTRLPTVGIYEEVQCEA
jgi:DNA invertase Pin-like site-specific DNA recombinase